MQFSKIFSSVYAFLQSEARFGKQFGFLVVIKWSDHLTHFLFDLKKDIEEAVL